MLQIIFISGYGGYDYAMSNYNNSTYMAYLQNLRETNPVAYTEWYNKYYANPQQQQQSIYGEGTTYSEDKASVHSGRSSCDAR